MKRILLTTSAIAFGIMQTNFGYASKELDYNSTLDEVRTNKFNPNYKAELGRKKSELEGQVKTLEEEKNELEKTYNIIGYVFTSSDLKKEEKTEVKTIDFNAWKNDSLSYFISNANLKFAKELLLKEENYAIESTPISMKYDAAKEDTVIPLTSLLDDDIKALQTLNKLAQSYKTRFESTSDKLNKKTQKINNIDIDKSLDDDISINLFLKSTIEKTLEITGLDKPQSDFTKLKNQTGIVAKSFDDVITQVGNLNSELDKVRSELKKNSTFINEIKTSAQRYSALNSKILSKRDALKRSLKQDKNTRVNALNELLFTLDITPEDLKVVYAKDAPASKTADKGKEEDKDKGFPAKSQPANDPSKGFDLY